jgi:stage II sporulation protein P
MSAGRKLFNRRFTSRRRSTRTARILLVIFPLIFLLAAALYRFAPQPALPAMAGQSKVQELQGFLSDRSVIFRQILSQVIPGLGHPYFAGKDSPAAGQGDDILTGTVSRLDPRDPWRIFSAQIPYISEVGYQPQTLIYEAGKSEGGPSTAPRIIIPSYSVQKEGRVIIYHTHTTESFLPTSGVNFTEELEFTVARLGTELATILRDEYNITVVHNTQIHDYNRDASYGVAIGTLRELLETYPDADLVVDLHRDGLDRRLSTAKIGGQYVGRILFVVGSRHPNWQENYQLAEHFHQILEEIAPGISRGVRERPLVYNQHLHPGSLLIEVGGNENSLEEALRAIPYLAEALSHYDHGGQ